MKRNGELYRGSIREGVEGRRVISMNQIDKKKIVVAVLLVILLWWRFIPRSFSEVISVDASKVISYACTVNICGIDDNAIPFVQPYDLGTVKKGDEGFEDVLSILDKIGYCPDFRNLLSWAITKVESDDDLNEMNAIVVFKRIYLSSDKF